MRRLASILTLCSALGACTPQHQPLVTPDAPTTGAAATAVAPSRAAQPITIEAALDREALVAGKAAKVVARIRLDAGGIALTQRPPLDLSLVIDTSGSMVGAPIDEAREAAITLLDGLRDGDRLTVVTFDSAARLLVVPTVVDRAKLGPIKDALGKMEARGTTDLAAGLALAMQYSSSGSAPETVRRMVVLGDGVPNDPSQIPGQIATAKGYGIAISTLGFGLEYDEVLLGQLAQGTGGRFHRIGPGESIAAAFRDEVMRIERAVATNMRLRLQPGPGVTIDRVLGHPSAPDAARAHTIAVADLAEGQKQDLFVELSVTAHRSGATVELLDATASYDDRTANAGRLDRGAFVAAKASDDAPGPNAEVTRGVALARVAAMSLDALALARAGDFAAAEALLRDGEAEARKLAKSIDEAKLLTAADELATLRKTLADERKRWEKAEREAQREARRVQPDPGSPRGAPSVAPTKVARDPMPAGDLEMVKGVHSRAVDVLQAH